MSIDYIQVRVRQTILSQCLAPIESWILTRLFKTEIRGDRVAFYACWDLGGESYFSDDELTKALSDSREVCPELCAEVEREIARTNKIQFGAINYEKIFQSIIQRSDDLLHISIEEFDRNTRNLYFDETLTLITADRIESIRAGGIYKNGDFTKMQIKHRTHDAASPYIRQPMQSWT